MSFYYFLTNQTTGKKKANRVQAISVHFSQNPNANHTNQINKNGERVRSRDEVAPSWVGGDRP